jgi:hypothetical protein
MTDGSGNAELGDRVLKRDALGRVKTDAARRDAILDEFERGGLSGVKFAAVTGIKYATFASWMQRRRRARGACRRKAPPGKSAPRRGALLPALGWVQAEVERRPIAAGPRAVLRLELPGGAIMEICHEAQSLLAARLLRALQTPAGGVAC